MVHVNRSIPNASDDWPPYDTSLNDRVSEGVRNYVFNELIHVLDFEVDDCVWWPVERCVGSGVESSQRLETDEVSDRTSVG